MDYRFNCVNKSKCSKFYFKTLFPYLREKLYALVWITLETRTTFNKAKIFNKYFSLSTWVLLMVQDVSLALKADNIEACFILSGFSFNKLRPELDIVSVPKCAVWIFLLDIRIPFLKLQLSFSRTLKTSCIIIGERLFLTLKISVAKYCKFFRWTETDLSFCNNFSKLDFLSWYNILRALWCMLLILLNAQLWHIQTNGQSLNWKVTNALNKMPFLFGDKCCDIQDNARSFWQDCRQRLLMCSSNAKLLSILTPKSFSELIHLMIESLMFYGSRLIGW